MVENNGRAAGDAVLAAGAGSADVSFSDRVLGCVLAGAAGDALGAPIEFLTIEQIRERFGPEGVWDYEMSFDDHRGSITDDTQMTLFTLEAMARAHVRLRTSGTSDVVRVTHRAYLRWLYTQGDTVPRAVLTGQLITEQGIYTRRAPGNTCLSALRATVDGRRVGTIEHPLNNSKGCGGVMRAAPVALWPGTSAEVFRLGAETAALTHGHPSGYLAAGALAVIVRDVLHGGTLADAVANARAELVGWRGHEETVGALDAAVALAREGRPTPEAVTDRLGAGWVAEEALAIAVSAALAATDMLDGLKIAVNHSGDSDSTGLICGNILGARDGVRAIPSRLHDHVELRWVIEPLVLDVLAEFSSEPPVGPAWLARYPPD
jgi:ADP-ribosylglycohydrolase